MQISTDTIATISAAFNDMTDEIAIQIAERYPSSNLNVAQATQMLGRTNAAITALLEGPEIANAFFNGDHGAVANEIAGAAGAVFGGYLGATYGAYAGAVIGGAILGALLSPAIAAGIGAVIGATVLGAVAGVFGEGLFEDIFNFFDNPPASPLVFDLDGDGIELTSVNSSTVFFDVSADGFAELTGWVGADDGLLALDVDGDGRIDNGSELFGDQTGQAHGFLALAEHDGNGDGVIDATDAVFNSLLIWQDINADGVSQAEEMRGLTEVGITSISTSATSTSYWVSGNEIRYEGSFSWADGTTGVVGDAFFEGDAIRTIAVLPDDFQYHPDVFKLPVLIGAGSLPSTWISLSQNDTLRQQAIDLVALASSGDIAGFRAGFTDFVMAWGGADDVVAGSRGPNVDARYLAFLENTFDQPFQQDGYGANPGINAGREITNGVENLIDTMAFEFLSQVAVSDALLNSTDAATYAAHLAANPLSLLTSAESDADRIDTIFDMTADGSITDVNGAQLLDLFGTQSSMLETDFQQIVNKASVIDGRASSIAVAIAMAGYNGTNLIVGSESNDTYSTAVAAIISGNGGDDTITGSNAADTYLYALGDGSDVISDFSYSSSESDRITFTDVNADDVTFWQNAGQDLVITLADGGSVTVTDHFKDTYTDMEQVEFADGTVLDLDGITAKLVADQSTDGDDAIVTGIRDDILAGGLGNDTLNGKTGSDIYLYALGDGSDVISDFSYSGSEADRISFTDVNADDVTFSQNAGQDLVITLADGGSITVTDHFKDTYSDMELIEFADGTVMDGQAIRDKSVSDMKATGTVLGSSYAETYRHSLGDGSYVIKDFSYTSSVEDRLILTDVNAGDVIFSQNAGQDLVITLADGGSVTVTDHFKDTYSDMERVEFADGTVLDLDGITAKLVADQSTDGDDTIVTGIRADVLAGGLGNDTLNGKTGSDTYLYALGDGSDVISDFSYSSSESDRITFTDVNADDVTFSQNAGQDLVITLADGGSITVTDHFKDTYSDMERVEFADGTAMNSQDLRDRSVSDMKATGTVLGSSYAETYRHSLGDGSYTIKDFSYSSGTKDTFVFTDLNAADIAFSQNAGQDLVMSLSNGETITVIDHFKDSYNDMELFEFADGTTLGSNELLIA